MRASFRCVMLTLAASAISGTFDIRGQSRVLVLDNVRIVDGGGGAPVERGRIVVEEGRIARIGPVEQVPLPAGVERVDLAGRTVLPGLIDLHFHIEDDPKLALRQLSN